MSWMVSDAVRLLVLRQALKLECLGMKRSCRRPSAYRIIKREFQLKGNKKKVLELFDKMLRDGGLVVRDRP